VFFLIEFLSEIMMLKRRKREGFRNVGVRETDSLAEHICITCQIAWVLAAMEGVDVSKCVKMALIHDNGEIRTGDHDWVGQSYLREKEKAELEALKDQTSVLEKSLGEEMMSLYKEKEEGKTKEAVVVQDADIIEVLLQAKIYYESGYRITKKWIRRIKQSIKTESGKKIVAEMEQSKKDFTDCWW